MPERPNQVTLGTGAGPSRYTVGSQDHDTDSDGKDFQKATTRWQGEGVVDSDKYSPTPAFENPTIPELTQPSRASQPSTVEGLFERYYRENGNSKQVLLAGALGLKTDDSPDASALR